MTTTVPPVETDVRSSVLKRLLRNPLGATSIVVLVVIGIGSMFAPVIAPHDPNATDLSYVFGGPSSEHLLGTDSAGRDVLSRLLFGGAVTFAAALLATTIAVGLGLTAGLIAGYYRGSFDLAATWAASLLMTIPGMVILLAVRARFGPNMWIAMIVFGVLLSPNIYRLVTTIVSGVRNELFVDAARVTGLSDARILGRHILSAVRAPVIIQTALLVGVAIAMQAGLEFLGLGDQSSISWGLMLNEGLRNVFVAPQFLVWPALAITIATASFALLGTALRDVLEERTPGSSAVHPDETGAGPLPEIVGVPIEPGSHLLDVFGLSIAYPDRSGGLHKVVDDVSLWVDRGEIAGLVGESGSGKTQTGFAILDLLPLSAQVMAGQIHFDGRNLLEARGHEMDALRQRRIAYVPQEPMSNLDPNFTVGYQLIRPLVKSDGLTSTQARKQAVQLLDRVGIVGPERVMSMYPHEISGGMAQRVLIAGAVSCHPELLIADEPTTALDVTVQAEVLDLLRELQADMNMGVLLVTHNFGVVADLCDRVCVMRGGRIVESGPTLQVLRSPQHSYTRELLAVTLEGKTPRQPLVASSKEER